MSTDTFGTGNENQQRIVGGFSYSPSLMSDRGGQETTDEEDIIAENIFEWWISGLSYKEWYARKFLQTKIDFE